MLKNDVESSRKGYLLEDVGNFLKGGTSADLFNVEKLNVETNLDKSSDIQKLYGLKTHIYPTYFFAHTHTCMHTHTYAHTQLTV